MSKFLPVSSENSLSKDINSILMMDQGAQDLAVKKLIGTIESTDNFREDFVQFLPNLSKLKKLAQREVINKIFLKDDLLEYTINLSPDLFKDVDDENLPFVRQTDVMSLRNQGKILSHQYEAFLQSLDQDIAINPRLNLTQHIAPCKSQTKYLVDFWGIKLGKVGVKNETEELVYKVMEKVITCEDIAKDREFQNKFYQSLTRVVDKNPVIKLILHAAFLEGAIVMESLEVTSMGETVKGYYNNSTKTVVIGSSKSVVVNKAIDTFIHELIHKICDYLFNNASNPFFYGDVTSELDHLSIISKIQENVNSKGHLIFTYDPDKYIREAIAHKYGEIAGITVSDDHMTPKGCMVPKGYRLYSINDTAEYDSLLNKTFVPVLKSFVNVKEAFDKVFKGFTSNSYLVLDYAGGFACKFDNLVSFLDDKILKIDENYESENARELVLGYLDSEGAEIIGAVPEITIAD